jgi:hypothetical protein
MRQPAAIHAAFVLYFLLSGPIVNMSVAKDCFVPFTVSVKRADGNVAVLATVSPSQSVWPAVGLAPGDSIVVDLNPNNYCAGIYPRLKVMDGCPAPGSGGEMIYHFPWTSENRHVFRIIGSFYLHIEGLFQYSGNACMLTYESAVGIEDVVPRSIFRAFYANGVIQIEGHEEGDLIISDASGRMLIQQYVPAGHVQLVPPSGFTGGLRLAVLRTRSGRRTTRFMAVDQ